MTAADDPLTDLIADIDDTAAGGPSRTTEPRRRSGKKGPEYRSALDESRTDRAQTARAVGKKGTVAGRYLRRSFTFRPEQLDRIELLAAELGLSQNDLMRWFTDLGIESVGQGQRPPFSEEVRRRYDPDRGP